VGYAVIAILWIAFSDAVVTYFKLYPAVMTIKGTVFVFVTASLLYFTISRLVQAVQLTSRQRDETAELYRTVVEASNEGICLLDESGRISFLNGHLAAMLGYPAEELQGRRLQDFIEEPHVLAQPGAQGSETHECRLRMDSGPKPWVLISRHPVLNDAGDVVRLVVTVIDISERKRSEKALRRSDAYPATVPAAAENPRENQLAGPVRYYGLAILSVGVALGAALFFQYFHFRDVAIPLLFLAIAISSWYGGKGPAILAAVLSTTSFYWYFIEPVQTIYIDWSNIPYFIVFAVFAALLSRFGTVRRRVEAGLREQAALLNLTHDTVLVMDMEGVVKYWNRGAEERYGWSAEQVLGKVVHDTLKTVFPSPLQEIKAELTRTGRWEGELLHTNKHGTQLVVASRWSLQRDRHGAPFAILETNNDISERKRAEEALSRLNRDLRAISYCNQALLRATDETSLLKEICRIVCEEAGYCAAWVGYAEHDEAKSVRPVAWTGTDEGHLASLGITWSDTERGRGLTGTVIRSGKTCCIPDFLTDPRFAPWRVSALQHGFRSGIALPLKDEHANTFGGLTIYCTQPGAFASQEIQLLEELAADLAFGIVTLRSQAVRKRAEEEITLLSFALDNVREAALLMDDTARFHYVNDEACRVLGYTRAELLDMSMLDVDPEFPAGRWSDHWRDLKAHRSLNFESRHRSRDGRVFPVQVSANYFEFRGRAYNLALVRDISERKWAEESLRRTTAYLAETQRLSHTGTFVTDDTTKPLFWSEELFRIFGFDPQHGLPTAAQVLQRIQPEDRDNFNRAFDGAIHGKVDSDVEYKIVLPDGRVKHVYGLGHPVLNANGEVVEVVGTTVDITERKRAEDAVRRSEAYLAEAQRLSHTGSFACDVASNEYVYTSEEFRRIFELDAQQSLPLREAVSRLIHREDWERVQGDFHRLLSEKVDIPSEFRIVLPSRAVKHIQVIQHPVLNDAGELVTIVGTAMDITERKRAAQELRDSETRFRTFVDHAGDALFVQDLDQGTIVDANRSACDSLGYTRQELIGKTPHDFHLDSDRAEIEAVMGRASAGETVSERHWHRRKDGSTFPVEAQTTLISYGGRRFLLKVARDISDRVRAEEQRDKLRQLEAELAHLERVTMLGELTASIAHEVNQPLSGVVSNGSACLRWLAGDAPNLEEAREAARRIVRDGKRAGEVIARIRALTRKASTPREKLDLNETIRQVLVLVGDEAKRKGVNIRAQFADDLSPVSGDQVQLQQVVLNLAMNAIEAMSKVGERARELVIATQNIDSDQVQVTVEDSGTGLDPSTMQKIFEPFYTTKPTGMGMGLSISRSIVQSHGGRLWATAKEGPGTVFSFTLPKYTQEESDAGVSAA